MPATVSFRHRRWSLLTSVGAGFVFLISACSATAASDPSTRGRSDGGAVQPAEEASSNSAAEESTGSTGEPLPAGVHPIADRVAPGSTGAVRGDVAVGTGSGDLALLDTDLMVELLDDGTLGAGTTGTASFELPTSGPLADSVIDRTLRGRVGVATGRELAGLGAHLIDERRYLYVDLGDQPFEVGLGLDGRVGSDGLPGTISAGEGSSASLFVTDLQGDYAYLSVDCVAMLPADRPSSTRPPTRRDNPHGDDDASDIPGVSVDLSGFDPGGCGIGWSASGSVPFVPLVTRNEVAMPSDTGSHLVLDGTVPLSAALSLDGELFFRFDSDRASIRANGELDIAVSFAKGAVEIGLPAVQGTFAFERSAGRLDTWIAATAGTSLANGTAEALLAELVPVRGTAALDGELHVAGTTVESSSFLQLTGELSIAPDPLREAAGVAVDDLLVADAVVRIDTMGITARGWMQASPLGALDVAGSAAVELHVPFADPLDSSFAMSGRLSVGGTALGAAAELRIDRSGAYARGELGLDGLSGVAVEGWLGANGFQLTGTADVVLPIGDLDRVAAGLIDQTSIEQTIAALDRRIDRRVDEIASRDAAKGRELRATVADMRQAFADIAATRGTIAYNDARIAELRIAYQADIDWHWSLSEFDRFWDKGPHAVRLGAILTEIGALEAANSVQYGYIDVANAVISGVQQVALGIVGWDEELNALLSLQTEAHLGRLVGGFVASVAAGADAVLDAFGVDGSARGTVTFTVGTAGVSAGATLSWCRDGSCAPLADATVTLSPAVEVCAGIVGIPTCVRLSSPGG